jgi:CRP-like cAMP-binding protein
VQRKLLGSDGPDRLGAVEFFAYLSEAHRRMLARLVDELNAEPGEVLMAEGDYGYEAIFIEDGAAEVRQAGEAINTIGPGEIAGELALLGAEGRRTASVVAASPLRALSLSSHSVHEIRARLPELATAIDRAAEQHRERDRRRAAERTAG